MNELMDLQYRQDDIARNRENRGRMAQVSLLANTTGPGSVEVEDAIPFDGAMFIEKPIFAFGCEIDADVLRDLLDLAPSDDVEFPHCTAHVTGWDVDENGCYSAAWIAMTVLFPASILITTPVEVVWHLAFSGIALKDVDPNG